MPSPIDDHLRLASLVTQLRLNDAKAQIDTFNSSSRIRRHVRELMTANSANPAQVHKAEEFLGVAVLKETPAIAERWLGADCVQVRRVVLDPRDGTKTNPRQLYRRAIGSIAATYALPSGQLGAIDGIRTEAPLTTSVFRSLAARVAKGVTPLLGPYVDPLKIAEVIGLADPDALVAGRRKSVDLLPGTVSADNLFRLGRPYVEAVVRIGVPVVGVAATQLGIIEDAVLNGRSGTTAKPLSLKYDRPRFNGRPFTGDVILHARVLPTPLALRERFGLRPADNQLSLAVRTELFQSGHGYVDTVEQGFTYVGDLQARRREWPADTKALAEVDRAFHMSAVTARLLQAEAVMNPTSAGLPTLGQR